MAVSQTILRPLSLDVSRDPMNHFLYWSDIMDGKMYAMDLESPMPVGPLNTGGVRSIAADGGTAYYSLGAGSGQPHIIVKDVVESVGDATVAVMQTDPGSVRITGNGLLRGVYLPALARAGRVELEGDPALVNVALPALVATDALRLVDDASLERIDLGALAEVGAITIAGVPALGSIDLSIDLGAPRVRGPATVTAPGLPAAVTARLAAPSPR